MTTETKETKGRDRTKELPQKTMWIKSLQILNVGDWFIASLLERTMISVRINELKTKKEYAEYSNRVFKTKKISDLEFRVIRIK